MDEAWRDVEQSGARFKKFEKIFRETLKQNEEQRGIIKNLTADLETSQTTICFFKDEILKKLEGESRTVQYARLLAKIGNLENQIALQREEEKKMQLEFQLEKQQLLEELDKEKRAHQTTESKLTNDLQIASNIAAIQYDELELKMQERLGTALAQLKESNNTCNMLRAEVYSLKQKLVAVNNSEEQTKRLEEKLRFAEEQLKMAREQNTRELSVSVVESAQQTKYNPLKIITFEKRDHYVNPVAFETNVAFNQCHVTEKQGKKMHKSATRSGFPIPPLKELGEPSGKTTAKKRRLFNPDNLDYLEDQKQQ